jgi:hypothetical protein
MQIFMVVAVVLAATGLVVVVDAQKAQRFFCDGSFFLSFWCLDVVCFDTATLVVVVSSYWCFCCFRVALVL